jgi:hypothetical protein
MPNVDNEIRPSYLDIFDDLGLWIVDSIWVGIWGLDSLSRGYRQRIINNISIDDRQQLK